MRFRCSLLVRNELSYAVVCVVRKVGAQPYLYIGPKRPLHIVDDNIKYMTILPPDGALNTARRLRISNQPKIFRMWFPEEIIVRETIGKTNEGGRYYVITITTTPAD